LTRRRLWLAALTAGVSLAMPAGAAAVSPTVRLTIAHVAQHCHASAKLTLGSPRTFAGESRVLVFRKAGVYRLTATNVQTPEERGLVTLGQATTLTLTVFVKGRWR
jgi:hypothetical protein